MYREVSVGCSLSVVCDGLCTLCHYHYDACEDFRMTRAEGISNACTSLRIVGPSESVFIRRLAMMPPEYQLPPVSFPVKFLVYLAFLGFHVGVLKMDHGLGRSPRRGTIQAGVSVLGPSRPLKKPWISEVDRRVGGREAFSSVLPAVLPSDFELPGVADLGQFDGCGTILRKISPSNMSLHDVGANARSLRLSIAPHIKQHTTYRHAISVLGQCYM